MSVTILNGDCVSIAPFLTGDCETPERFYRLSVGILSGILFGSISGNTFDEVRPFQNITVCSFFCPERKDKLVSKTEGILAGKVSVSNMEFFGFLRDILFFWQSEEVSSQNQLSFYRSWRVQTLLHNLASPYAVPFLAVSQRVIQHLPLLLNIQVAIASLLS